MKRYTSLIILVMMIFVPLSVVQAEAVKSEEVTKVLLLGKIEANIWESAAAIFFHIADHDRDAQRIALDDYNDDITTIKRVISRLENMKLSAKEAAALSDIKKAWKTIKADGDALIKIDIEREESASADDSKMRNYWLDVEKLDHKIDQLIATVAGSH